MKHLTVVLLVVLAAFVYAVSLNQDGFGMRPGYVTVSVSDPPAGR